MKPGKVQKSKEMCHDLCWKVHDHAQHDLLITYTMLE